MARHRAHLRMAHFIECKSLIYYRNEQEERASMQRRFWAIPSAYLMRHNIASQATRH